VTNEGVGRHRLGPDEGDDRVEHREAHVLSLTGAQAGDDRRGDRLGGGQRGDLVGDDDADHARAAVFVGLNRHQAGQGLDDGIVSSLVDIRAFFAEAADRDVD
jgi:hypothetical protein